MYIKDIFRYVCLFLIHSTTSSEYSNEISETNTSFINPDISRLYSHTHLDNENITMRYFQNNTIMQNPLIQSNMSIPQNISSTASFCMDLIKENENITSIDDFYHNFMKYDFTQHMGCNKFQNYWTNSTDCYREMNFDSVANIDLKISTPDNIKVYSIVEKFMSEVVYLSNQILIDKSLDPEAVLVDRPMTYIYLLLESIRNKNPTCVNIWTKFIMKRMAELVNNNFALFETNRSQNEIKHSLEILFLIKTENATEVSTMYDLGVGFIFLDGSILTNEGLIAGLVREHLEPLFEVCQNNEVKNE